MQNSSSVNISLYIEGNLCFQNSSSVAEDEIADGVPQDVNLEVRGRIVWQNGSSKGIGNTAISSPANGAVTTAKIGGGCASALTGASHPCSSPGDYFYVQSGGYTTTAPAITTPVLTDTDFTNYYGSTYVRPGDPCDNPGPNAGNRLPNTTFDNDTTALNGTGGNGSAATFDLTPSSSYTCARKDRRAGPGARRARLGQQRQDPHHPRHVLFRRRPDHLAGRGRIAASIAAGNHPTGDLTGNDGIGGQAVHLRLRRLYDVEQRSDVRLEYPAPMLRPRAAATAVSVSGHRIRRC